jgi:hypothetical protein
MLYPSSGNLILGGEKNTDSEMAMAQFETILTETLVITISLGIPLVILFLIGYLIRLFALRDQV